MRAFRRFVSEPLPNLLFRMEALSSQGLLAKPIPRQLMPFLEPIDDAFR